MASCIVNIHFNSNYHPVKVSLLPVSKVLREQVLHVSDGANAAFTLDLSPAIIEQLEAALAAAKAGEL